MNWSAADMAYQHAKDNHLVFRYHVLAWGSQYPEWIKTLSPAEFQAEMEAYMAGVSARYPLIDQIEVLNENMYINTWNKEEHAEGTPYFREGLGGPGETGYDWAIWLFEKARFYFPNAKLILNDFELETNGAGRNEILDLVKVLRDRGLIDGFGTQAHYFNVDGILATTLRNALNGMAQSGLPVYVTEMDLKGKTTSEASQLTSYKTAFPVYWDHPAVAGITLWGYVEGSTWSAGTGILNSDGTERSAMTWLKSYMAGLPDVGYPFNGPDEIVDKTGTKYLDHIQSISIFPNPVKDGMLIAENKSGENLTQLELIDLQGKIVKSLKPDQSSAGIEVSGLKKGMYFLRIHSEGSQWIEKIVIL
jgi:GH35 family endo-1,4-beta-xylanase